MARKIAGRLAPPPGQDQFDRLPLSDLCCEVTGVYVRLHAINHAKGEPWPPLHFGREGNSRFDSEGEVGTLCMAQTLAGALMELFDDHWGPVGSIGRSVTETTLDETWASLVSLPPVKLFDATSGNLSKIGTDAQLLTGDYSTTRQWAVRMKSHPDQIDGLLYRSRHDPSRLNVALFERPSFFPPVFDGRLGPDKAGKWKRKAKHGRVLVHGDALRLSDHPELNPALIELQVARIP